MSLPLEARCKEIVDSALDGMALFEVTPDGRFRHLECNAAYERITGFRRDLILDRHIDELLPAELLDPVTALYWRCAQSAETVSEQVVLGRSARKRVFEATLVPLRDGSTRVVRIVCTIRDVSERAHMLEQVEYRERRYRTLAEHLPDLVVRYDRHCRRVFVNPAHAAITQIPSSRVIGTLPDHGWRAVMPVEEYKARLRRVMATGVSDEFIVTWRCGDRGGVVHFAVRVVVEHDIKGQVVGVLAIGRNVTAMHEMQRQLQESRDLLHEFASHRESAREEERKRIAREIHDEMGQLLTSLRLRIATMALRLGEQAAGHAEYLQDLISLTDRTLALVRDVVSQLRPAALDAGLVAALEWLVVDFKRSSGIACHLRVPAEKLALGDEKGTAVFRIVQESLTNVARHARATSVAVTLESQGKDRLTLEVRDDGQGFDPDATGRKSFGLTGIRERALMLGGDVEFISRPGTGTTVRVGIPGAAAQPAARRRRAMPKRTRPSEQDEGIAYPTSALPDT